MAWVEMNGDSAPLREGSFFLWYVPQPGTQKDPAMSVTVTLEIGDLLKSIPDFGACGFYKTAFIQGSGMFSISNQMEETAGMERAVTAGRRLGAPGEGRETRAPKGERLPQTKPPLALQQVTSATAT